MHFVASWGLFVFCVLTETMVFMFQITRPGRTRSTRDSRAVGLITTRLQIEASLGSLAKDNIKIWRLCRDGNMNDTPSWLHSTSKVRRHSSSPKLVWCSVESHHQQTVSWKKALITATTVARATHKKNWRNYFYHRWHLHLTFGEPRSEPETRMRRYPQMRSQAITASSWQWWRSLQVCHLVRGSSATRNRERDSFFTWLNDFTLRMPRTNWRQLQQRTVALAMEFTPAESPQANTVRSRIEQEQQQQHAMYPPPRPVGPGGTTFIDLSQAQPSQQYQGAPNIPNQMVSALLWYFRRTEIRTFVVGSFARTFCMLISIDCTCSWTFADMITTFVDERYKYFNCVFDKLQIASTLVDGLYVSLLMCVHVLFQIQQRLRSAPPQSSLWPDQPWSSPSFLGGSPYNMSMSEYLNVGSQQSQNSQLNTPPFPQRSTAPAAAGSASQLAAGSPKVAASSTIDQATNMDVDPRPQKNTNPAEWVD